MVEPGSILTLVGTVTQPLLNRVVKAAEIAINYNKYCSSLNVQLLQLQPFLDRAPVSCHTNQDVCLLHTWLDDLEKSLNHAEMTLNKCIDQRPKYYNIWLRHQLAKEILNVTKSINDLIHQASSLVGLDVGLSILQDVQTMKDMMMEESRKHLSNVTRHYLDKDQYHNVTALSSEATYAIQTAFHEMSSNEATPYEGGCEIEVDKSMPLFQAPSHSQHFSPKFREVPPLVFGLDKFTNTVKDLILTKGDDASAHYVGVWGMGGVGKTLLAQRVHNSMDLQQNFQEVLWLTVGQNPNIMSLYGNLSNQLGGPNLNYQDGQVDCKHKLYTRLSHTRALLILDDVWESNVVEWLDVAKGPGSVTLLTTRNQHVLQRVRAIEVGLTNLSMADSWSLFCVHAFGQSSIVPHELEETAQLLAKECKGLPLALKVIGGVMAGKKSLREWKRELNKLQDSRVNNQDVGIQLFEHLKISYDDLRNVDHPNAKECFLYFAAFPEDAMIRQTTLCDYWAAEGLVPGHVGDEREEDVYYVLGLLIGRSVIELGDERSCKIHDVIRDLAFYIIQHDALVQKQLALYKPGRHLEEFPHEWIMHSGELLGAQRLSLKDNKNLKMLPTKFCAPKLQSLLLDRLDLKELPRGFLTGVPNLKVLDLSWNRSIESLPKELGHLIHLVYLSLEGCENLKELPKSIGKLQKLVFLHLSSCSRLKKLPTSIAKLLMLENLDLRSCEKLEYLPVEMSNLKALQSLQIRRCNKLQWPKPQSKHSNWLSHDNILLELVALKQLNIDGPLKILESIHTTTTKLNMRSLDIGKLSSFPTLMQSMVELEGLEIVELGPRIRALPSWMTSFLQLKNLTMVNCESVESIPALDTLPMLLQLKLWRLTSITKLPGSFTRMGGFPTLEVFDLYECEKLTEFPEVEEGAMPKLRELGLIGCVCLQSLPLSLSLLSNVQELDVSDCNDDLLTFCKVNFRDSPIWKSFLVDGKCLITKEEI